MDKILTLEIKTLMMKNLHYQGNDLNLLIAEPVAAAIGRTSDPQKTAQELFSKLEEAKMIPPEIASSGKENKYLYLAGLNYDAIKGVMMRTVKKMKK